MFPKDRIAVGEKPLKPDASPIEISFKTLNETLVELEGRVSMLHQKLGSVLTPVTPAPAREADHTPPECMSVVTASVCEVRDRVYNLTMQVEDILGRLEL